VKSAENDSQAVSRSVDGDVHFHPAAWLGVANRPAGASSPWYPRSPSSANGTKPWLVGFGDTPSWRPPTAPTGSDRMTDRVSRAAPSHTTAPNITLPLEQIRLFGRRNATAVGRFRGRTGSFHQLPDCFAKITDDARRRSLVSASRPPSRRSHRGPYSRVTHRGPYSRVTHRGPYSRVRFFARGPLSACTISNSTS
jgi:hypothetical protein